MFPHVGHPLGNTNRVNMWLFSGTALTTTSGTLSAVAGDVDTPYMSITKVAGEAGRYRVQMIDRNNQAVGGFKLFEAFTVAVIGAADAAYTAGKALPWFIRNKDPQGGVFDIQFCQVNGVTDYLDDELEDGASFTFSFLAKKSSAP